MEEAAFQHVLELIQDYGFLLESDTKLPSVASSIADEPIRGSWWGHPQGHTIYTVCNRLSELPDLLITKLVSGKITYVHHRLWSALIGVGIADEPWQLENLSYATKWLLDKVRKTQIVETDRMQSGFPSKVVGDAVRELEKNLLVYSESFHTISGKHAKRLETWVTGVIKLALLNRLLHRHKANRYWKKSCSH